MPETFKSATWNFGGGEPVGPTDRSVKRLVSTARDAGVSVLLGQEVQEAPDREILEGAGYRIHRYGPECLVAWLPEIWTGVAPHDLVLNPENPFHRKDRPADVFCKQAGMILCDAQGRSLDVGSYHTPSSVQEPEHQKQDQPPSNRIAALREATRKWRQIANESECRAVLLGGDDNVDEDYGDWAFMLQPATGLRLVQAPSNTLGHRQVDDFRVRGLVPLPGGGRVVHGPTDHNMFIQTWRFRDA